MKLAGIIQDCEPALILTNTLYQKGVPLFYFVPPIRMVCPHRVMGDHEQIVAGEEFSRMDESNAYTPYKPPSAPFLHILMHTNYTNTCTHNTPTSCISAATHRELNPFETEQEWVATDTIVPVTEVHLASRTHPKRPRWC